MSVLVIKGIIPNEKRLKIKVDNQEKILDATNSSVCFSSLKSKTYHVYITEEKIPKPPEIILWVLYVLTMPIQGLIHVLLINNDRKWYKDISPYYIKKIVLEINLNQTLELNLEYRLRGFDPILEKWDLPELSIIPYVNVNICLETDITIFKDQYLRFIRKVLSVFSIGFLLLFFLLWIAIKNHILLASVVVTIVLVMLALATVFVVLYNYKVFCRLRDSFVRKNKI